MGRWGLLNDISSELRGGRRERTGVLAAVRQGASLPPQRSRRLLQLLLQDDFTQVGLDLGGGCTGRGELSHRGSHRLPSPTEKNNWSMCRHLVQFLLLKSSEAPQLVIQLSILLLVFIPLTPPPQFTFCRKGKETRGGHRRREERRGEETKWSEEETQERKEGK